MKNGNKERGGSRKLGCVPEPIPPLLSTPSWAATFSHLCKIINEKAFRERWRTWLTVQTATDTSWLRQAKQAAVRINWTSVSRTKNRLFYILTLSRSHRISRFSHNRVDENQSIISITRDICHTFPNTWQSHREAQLLLHGRLFK